MAKLPAAMIRHKKGPGSSYRRPGPPLFSAHRLTHCHTFTGGPGRRQSFFFLKKIFILLKFMFINL
jgi:hypothetical protein